MNSEFDKLIEQAREYLALCGRNEHVFSVRPEQAALLVVDMQNFVCSPKDGRTLAGLPGVIDAINRLVTKARERNVPVIWLRQHFDRDENGDNAGLYPALHKKPLSPMMYGNGPDTELYAGMQVDTRSDRIVFKNRYSAFAPGSSNLDEVLRNLKVGQLWICGVATNVCVESTARDAMQRDIETIIIADATATAFELIHKVSLLNFQLFFGDVRTTQELLDHL
jgi:nicotinamidase-related amidase